jgi:CRP-like cAMP-binding protein
VLDLPGRPVQNAQFIEGGFVSVLLKVGDVVSEIGLIGREGMLGVPAVLGSDVADYRVVARTDLSALQVPIEAMRQAVATRRAIAQLIIGFIQVGLVQIAHTSFANACQTIPQRLARWLLMAHDRMDMDTLVITHDALSHALGVRRPGVTLAIHELEGDHVIRSKLRALTILDREKLKAIAGPAYGPAEAAYDLLIGRPAPGPN